MPKWLQRFIMVLLTWWLLFLFLQPFADINPIGHPRALVVYVIGISLILYVATFWPQWWPFWGIITIAAMIGGLWAIVPLKLPFGLSWLTAYLRTFSAATSKFLRVGGIDVPTVLSMTLIITLVAFLLLLTVVVRFYPGAIAIVLSYLLAVHIFNGNDLTTQFIQLAVLTGLMAMLHLYGNHWWPLLIGCTLISGVTLGLAWLSTSTSLNEQLADISVPFRDRLNQRGFYAGIQTYINGSRRTGYTENSRVLGGPVYDDPTPVFTATSAEASYYRVAVDATYTGTGWQPGVNQSQTVPLDGAIMRDPNASVDYGPAQSTTLIFNGSKSFLPLPYGQLTFTGGQPDPTTDFLLNTATRRVSTINQSRFQRIDIQVQPKQITSAQLTAATSNRQQVGSRYLQLPSTLPKRVKQLAEKITAKAQTPYEKVLAIQNYLKSDPRFTYSKTDAQLTPPGHDYVDYFLFDAPIGYCDNFSSAMVVLCRSIGLPARWAKGFNTGTFIGGSGQHKEYVIRNSNAHSWPEVYFTNLGWLPFEPTPGFNDPATPQENIPAASANNSVFDSTPSSSSVSSSAPVSRKPSTSSPSATKTHSRSSLSNVPWLVISLLIVSLLLIILAFWQLPALVAWLIGIGLTTTRFPRRYRLLLWSLRRIQHRPASQTLSAYAKIIDTRLGEQTNMSRLTQAYEQMIFGKTTVNPETLALSLQALRRQLFAYTQRAFHVKHN
ncbi:transglutaminase [Lacticaseibacillus chiayiensis]|uniref:Transglutaminase n=1 Tax=Lacticaseibacillus chiayiensis TaxID=2100821 RepID=A0A4Q1TL04_9LACO|nr:transglutaminase domain-containing protein [Lacticaseibacillus chiayiensis]QVI34733.1 transglutaminase [Lacticaseibacillus chiayiensis]RXT18953.1 transglutaminase [Lacticaseibacillus chiayiensis]UYN56483.1 transglutaminase [Lacticaseibacillus chiayiensis]